MAVQPPKQPRSEASLARLVAAARELLERESFEELTVARVAQRARSSVGVFYSRFRDKQGLLEHLGALYAQEAHAEVQAFGVTRGACIDAGLEAEVRAVVRFVIAFHRSRAGLIRALLQEARARPGGRTARLVKGMKSLPPTLERRVLLHHPGGGLAEGFFVVVSAVRERVLFGEGAAGSSEREDEELAELLSRGWMGILGPGQAAAQPRRALYS